MRNSRALLVILALLLVYPSIVLAAEDKGCNVAKLKVELTSLNSSAVTGKAAICIGEDGLRGSVYADNLTVGHGYTVWFFYSEGTSTAGPGRFDSTVAENDDEIFRGHVGGLQVSSGAKITLKIFDHPNLGSDNVARARNLLTASGGSGVAQAVFDIP